ALQAMFSASDARYRDMEEIFLRSQAGVLAGNLVDGLPCPVCGATDHPAPAELSVASVTETELKNARGVRDRAQANRESKAARCGALRAEIETLGRRFLADFSEFAPGADWKTSKQALAALLSAAQREAETLSIRRDASKKALDALTAARSAAAKRKTDAESALLSANTLARERAAHEEKVRSLRADARSAYDNALHANGFADESAYTAALLSESELSSLNRRVLDYEKRGEQLSRDIARLEGETDGREPPDLPALRARLAAEDSASRVLRDRRDECGGRLGRTEGALRELRRAAAAFEKAEQSYAAVRQLSDTANGKLDFETYAQTAYFERVLRAANLRLKLMSQNRYMLLRKTDRNDGRRRSGLELEVLDAYTGKTRASGSLSGGESFMASLSLALGLSDIVQQSAGGIRLDAMFIDEGFGSLDGEVLELAIRTLSEMAGRDRVIGIISHVSELRERIDRQIQVEKTPAGSKIRMVG
ncbi:MAG: hypothetical protein FWC62_07515, partial [Firmicutes bacterium]|nr:hypothetical protein [Bacillota bacterium]